MFRTCRWQNNQQVLFGAKLILKTCLLSVYWELTWKVLSTCWQTSLSCVKPVLRGSVAGMPPRIAKEKQAAVGIPVLTTTMCSVYQQLCCRTAFNWFYSFWKYIIKILVYYTSYHIIHTHTHTHAHTHTHTHTTMKMILQVWLQTETSNQCIEQSLQKKTEQLWVDLTRCWYSEKPLPIPVFIIREPLEWRAHAAAGHQRVCGANSLMWWRSAMETVAEHVWMALRVLTERKDGSAIQCRQLWFSDIAN